MPKSVNSAASDIFPSDLVMATVHYICSFALWAWLGFVGSSSASMHSIKGQFRDYMFSVICSL